jgi:hypothetical protein
MAWIASESSGTARRTRHPVVFPAMATRGVRCGSHPASARESASASHSIHCFHSFDSIDSIDYFIVHIM